MRQSSGFIDWRLGQDANILMMFIGFYCCCGLPIFFKMHALRTELKNQFGVDDSTHILAVLIPIYGLYITHKQISELEAKYDVKPVPPIPWHYMIFAGGIILWPICVKEQMDRLNAIADKLRP
ncbi:MAG: hypothetical protein E7040_07240 [Lentisphaerae bacterium]|nr:hypothetical protein [Lentisphaerota bacterium]